MSNTAHQLRLRSLHQHLQRYRSSRFVLRSQLGFESRSTLTCPEVCCGCRHYHGQFYGVSKADRRQLICAMHPLGWQEESPCVDWQQKTPP